MSELALVAGPFLVDGFICSAVRTNILSGPVVEPNIATIGASCADRFGGLQVPWPCSEAVFRRRQGTYRAYLNDVSAELRFEIHQFESRWLHVCAPETKREFGLATDFFCESDASSTLDATFQIERHIFAEGKRLWKVPLQLDKPGRRGPICQSVVLKWTFTTSVTDWTI